MLSGKNRENTAKQRERRFIELYKACFPSVARSIRKMGGDLDQARDVFQDALIIYYEKERNGNFVLTTSENAYLFGIARHLWIRKYKEQAKTVPFHNGLDVAIQDTENRSTGKILRYLEAAGQKCMDLLKAFYYDETKLEQIAEEFGFSGTRSATVQKFKCLEKVREKVKEKSLVYEDFVD